jgi:hypothetical protein
MAKTGTTPRSRAWAGGGTALGGVTAGLAIVMAMRPADMAASKVGGMTASLVAMPPPGAWAVVLTTGLVLYVAGLFGSLRENGRR